jgi:DNA-binding MarR family transcriptional regulator
MHRHFGHRLRILHWCTDQAVTNALAELELTSAQGRILGYLAMRKTAPCPKDIEEELRLSHPTVSGLLSRLEKKGFLEFRSDEADRRVKRIYLLDKGKACNASMYETIRSTEEKLVAGFTEEEKEQFFSYLNRAIDNMDCGHCNPKHKEDSQA